MRFGLVLTEADPETAFNALRLALYALGEGDEVRIFLSGRGVELDRMEDPRFDVKGLARDFLERGGRILACGTCLKLRESEGSDLCPLSSLGDLYELVRDSDRLLTF